ncbi:MAG: M13 family metallopeptidase [Paludibacteraceae bacterium]|nr:M13 family metallopeptidase [Paludibacteraceae bacterium]
MKLKHLSLITLTIMMASCATSSKQSEPEPLGMGIRLENLDTTVSPQQDFYQFACGGWMQLNPLTDEYSRFGSFDKLGLKSQEDVKYIVDSLSRQENPSGSIEQKIGDLYNLVMDSVCRNADGIRPLRPYIDRVMAWQSRSDMWKDLPDLYVDGLCGMFEVYVDADMKSSKENLVQTQQGGYAMGQREYYLENDEKTASIRAQYLKHVERMFGLFGIENPAASAQTVLRMETALAQAAYDNVTLRDPETNYNKMTIEQAAQAVPQIDWDTYLTAIGLPETKQIALCQQPHMQEVGRMLDTESLADLKTYFVWQMIDHPAGMLSDEVDEANFDFYGRVISGKKAPAPRWKRAVSTCNSRLGEAVGQIYVRLNFPEENKQRMQQLVRNLQVALGERIDAQEWMSDSTKAVAHEKLDAFYVKIGYPDKWRDYTALDINPQDSYLENIIRSNRFETAYQFRFAGRPVDRDRWYMTPQTVNAYYNPTTNEICFPAAILQYPFFDMSADDAFNYGAIGVVIGHEMTHGFDDQGSQFDKDGNLRLWWTKEDREKFEERTKVMADYFDSIYVAPGVHANGRFTLGENMADHGGLMVAFQAFKNATKDNPLPVIEGYSPEQRFFMAYAGVWAGNIRDEEILSRTKADPHSLGRWRTNGQLPHIDAWYEAFNVTEDSEMYVPKEQRVTIW